MDNAGLLTSILQLLELHVAGEYANAVPDWIGHFKILYKRLLVRVIEDVLVKEGFLSKEKTLPKWKGFYQNDRVLMCVLVTDYCSLSNFIFHEEILPHRHTRYIEKHT